uniref:Uncharacterized protein n=1 Tax=Anguilla anguilla TaxID=7936 RepID=A0A0E9S0T1_ANGAN
MSMNETTAQETLVPGILDSV